MNEPADKLVTIEVTVASDTADEIERLIAQRGWERDEGLRLILAGGFGYCTGVNTVQAIAAGTMSAEDLQGLVSRSMEMESRFAALRFRAFQLEVANRNWELSTGAIQAENDGLRFMVRQLRDEIAALETQIKQQERKTATLQTEVERQRALPSAADAHLETIPLSPQLAPKVVHRSFWHRQFRRAGA
jgi:hypothetical protein